MKNIDLENPYSDRVMEGMEKHYLEEIVFIIRTELDKLLNGLNTKEFIGSDWENFWGKNTTDYATGAERIYYWIFNQFGIPNSTPVGSDLVFERKDAYIHIDIKTVSTNNLGDVASNIFVGDNQNSYSGEIITKKEKREYSGQLPEIYSKIVKNKINNPDISIWGI